MALVRVFRIERTSIQPVYNTIPSIQHPQVVSCWDASLFSVGTNRLDCVPVKSVRPSVRLCQAMSQSQRTTTGWRQQHPQPQTGCRPRKSMTMLDDRSDHCFTPPPSVRRVYTAANVVRAVQTPQQIRADRVNLYGKLARANRLNVVWIDYVLVLSLRLLCTGSKYNIDYSCCY